MKTVGVMEGPFTIVKRDNLYIGRMPLPFFPNEKTDIETLFVNADIVLKRENKKE